MPFTTEQFFQVFEKYNQNVFPMQIVLILMALAAILSANLSATCFGKTAWKTKFVSSSIIGSG